MQMLRSIMDIRSALYANVTQYNASGNLECSVLNYLIYGTILVKAYHNYFALILCVIMIMFV